MYSSLRNILKIPRPNSETSAGQHFVECDNCETEAAQFFCKSCQEETIRIFEEEEENASGVIDKTILEIKESARKLEDRKDELGIILAGDDEDLKKSMCMKIKEEKLTPKRMSYEVEDFHPGSLENNILQQIFGKRPAISNQETVQHNRFVNWVSSKLEKIEIKSSNQ
uniref:B box-type domain-containing protein n=1 Tax=Magallana gigas TaxID=29159 RepID=A0A8W8P325_MAGGI